jgi:hypothetical protein
MARRIKERKVAGTELTSRHHLRRRRYPPHPYSVEHVRQYQVLLQHANLDALHSAGWE